MGGLWKKMPVTWVTALVGSLALIGVPFFSGYYSKDSIIIAAHAAANAGQWGATVAYWALTIGVFITAFYSFRMFFLVFHGKPRWHLKPSAPILMCKVAPHHASLLIASVVIAACWLHRQVSSRSKVSAVMFA